MNLYRDFTTQAEIDEQYDVERSVPDFTPYAELYISESARVREEMSCSLDIPFGPTVEETVDIFPAAEAGAPILVFIHGGYWRILSSKEFSLVARGLVGRGVTVVISNYALCPKVTLSEITRQSRAVIAWLRTTDFDVPGDRDRIFVSGHSAGGHQTARLLSTDWAGDYGLPANVVKGGFAISGLFDLRPLVYSFVQPMLQLDERLVQTESPLLHIPKTAPPLVASVGGAESEEFRRQSKDYVAACKGQGLTAAYSEQADKNHFTAITDFTDPASPLCDEVCAFIEACEGG